LLKQKTFNFKNLEIMNVNNLNLVELNAQEVQQVDGGNGVHSGGTGLVAGQNLANSTGELIHAVGDFFRGFFVG
jgi:hypothetical protein